MDLQQASVNAFSGSVAIVTGAASGLGLALSRLLHAAGCKVILADIDSEALMRQKCGQAAVVDVSNFTELQHLVQETVRKYGRLDYFFNNAATTILGEVRDLTIDDWNKILSVNLHGVVHGVQAAYPVMIAQKSGHIVNISSLTGITPSIMVIPYSTAKYGIVGLSHSLRMEAKQWGVKVSVACPSLINTPIWTSSQVRASTAKRPLDYLALFTPKPKLIHPEQAAKAILKGVLKNKATIISDNYSLYLWWTYRLCPTLWMWFYDYVITKKFRTLRK